MTRLCLLSLILLSALSLPTRAMVEEPLDNPVLETRAQALYTQLRCVVCQNQSIADSNAELAQDLRALVRHRLQDGASDSEILNYVHERYGDFVLMKPPVKPVTWALWGGPFLILLLGGILVFRQIGATNTPANEDETS